MSGRQKVVIVGGGIAGLTAAHELIERDFDVEVYEHRFRCGGKAASTRVHRPREGDLPGEHGFRFFPGWYRHLPDTLGRIPSDRHRGQKGEMSVLDHLVSVGSNLLASYNRDPIPIVLHAPRSADQAQKLLSFVVQIQRLGLSIDDAVLFFTKLMEFLSVPDEVRRQTYDNIAWTTLVDLGNRTPAFRLLTSHTRSLVAAKPAEVSAYTIATMAVRTLFASSLTIDRVLDGPTSEVWIEPWVRYLEGQGVTFKYGYDLDRINFSESGPSIKSLHFSPLDDDYRDAAATQHMRPSEYEDWRRARDSDGTWPQSLDEFRTANRPRDPVNELETRDATYFIFAIPIEQMAYYINRSTMMTYHDESLRDIVRLSSSVDWMAGIQFYLRTPINIEAGHIVCADSEWALTAIDQSQFWHDAGIPKDVQSILSVDISAWDKKGRHNNKEAFRCSRDEIAEEVWQQLSDSFNRDAGKRVFEKAMLINRDIKGSYNLDDNVAERYDRAKQAEYNRAQSVRFGADEVLSQGASSEGAPFIFGERLEMNVEPILINRVGTLALRPAPAREEIPNMFLAGDYVDTATNLACMESANEAARLAVNAILDRAGSNYGRCQTWDFADKDILSTAASVARMVEQAPGVRRSLETATSAANTIGAVATRAGQNLLQLWKKR